MILPLILILIGFGLVLAEVFFPSLGVLSILAGISIIASVILAFQESNPFGIAILTVAVAGVPVTVFLAFRVFPRTPVGRRMVNPGFNWKAEERAAVQHRAAQFVGRSGVAESPLRPAGIADFAGERLDVVTRGEHVDPGTRVRAVRFVANRLIVEAEPETETQT
ncbi:MAG: hypothetical protein DWQ01_13360 [Planctomycetota bacterium]|nr:MAG: hypothetical protein DWQ01_13360 [Planctomycetota bacterium]